jgi:hypothetical protein
MEWIKVNKLLHTNFKVLMIAEALGMDPELIAYKIIQVWAFADTECTAENPRINAPSDLLDKLVRCPGLAKAMADLGWLIVGDGWFEFPKFERHMGKSAKLRALDAEKKRCKRDKIQPVGDKTGTERGQNGDKKGTTRGQAGDKTGTEKGPEKRRGEEIREEKKESSLRSDSLVAVPSPMTPPPSPVLLVFPVDGSEKNWPLTQCEVDRLQELYGSLDVLSECKKALAWITSSHTNRKTYGGMLKFLTNWLNKATTLPKPTQRPSFFDRQPERKLRPLASEMMPPDLAAEIFGEVQPVQRLEVRHG